MLNAAEAKLYVRVSSATSLKPAADRLGAMVNTFYDTGDRVRASGGSLLRRTSPDSYLATGDVVISNFRDIDRQITKLLLTITADPLIASLMTKREVAITVWIAFFGEVGAVSLADFPFDRRTFGNGIGLVAENYTKFDVRGHPEKLVIEGSVAPAPSSRR